MKKQDANESRKPYTKPELRRVQLRPEEAVLGGCKIASGSGASGICGATCFDVGT